MDAKAMAKEIRTAVNAARRTPGDVLHGLDISTRYRTGSLTEAIDVHVKGLDVRWVQVPHPTVAGGRQYTPYAEGILARLRELAGPAAAWADGRHSFLDVGFVDIQGVMADPQEDAAARARLEARCRDLTAQLAAAREELADPRPRCPNGHGPMDASSQLREDADDEDPVGTLHACTKGCGAAVMVPTAAALAAWAQRTMAAKAAAAPQLGRRRGTAGLAAVL